MMSSEEKVFNRSVFFFKVQFDTSIEKKANSTIKQQKFEGKKKRDRFLISKVDFNFKIS